MVPDIDIYRAANLLIERYGDKAVIEAAKRIDTMLERGDLAGRDVWRRISRAIADLQAQPRKDALH
jgi:hypothetical protein